MPFLRSTGNIRRLLLTVMFVLCVLGCGLSLAAQENASPAPTVSQQVGFAISPPLSELAKQPQPSHYGFHEALPVRRVPKPNWGESLDPVEQTGVGGAPSTDYSIGLDFLGVGNGFPSYSVTAVPPDTNLAVGDTQIIQWVNLSFAIFDKYSGQITAGPIEGNLLFTALGGPCAVHNDGDIIAQWDNAAHQWVLAQNVFEGPPYYACVAVSQTANALGAYYLYQFPLGNGFPDYPKWGRWNTTWGQTMNNFGPGGSGFQGAEVCEYERAKMLVGSPARQVCFQLSSQDDSLLPADIDSVTSPPSTECQFFIGSLGNVSNSQLSLYSACIDWLHPGLAYMSGNHNSQLITIPTFTSTCNGNYGGDCVPQEGVTDKLDTLGDRLMYRFAYDNDPVGGNQHWYVNHDVQASTFNQAAVRWYEFQAPQIAIMPLGMTLYQSGTYAPDGTWRWMGSIAADQNHDILVGYSKSCGNTCPGGAATYPSIEVAGRLSSATLGTLEPEIPVVAGSGSQQDSGDRWGDYSAMRIDPDGCTFWYTTEYYLTTASFDWSTQIASVKFAGCHNAAYDGYIELCKETDPDYPVTGTFNFNLTAPFFSSGPYAVPVGACSPAIEVPSGEITITEAPVVGALVENVTAYSYDQFGNYINELDSWTPPNLTATVSVMPGGVNLETIATFTNYQAPPGTLKVCKIAGSPSLVGTPFMFTATGLPAFQINAGPPPGGSCEIVGTAQVNSQVTITETLPAGVYVSNITVEPANRAGAQTPDSIVVTMGTGVTEVDFTDTLSVVQGSCQPSESLSIMVIPTGNGCNLSGGCVVAWVPEASWVHGNTGVAVANVEGGYIVGAPLTVSTSDYINACGSDPLLTPPQTVCTASNEIGGQSNNVYVLTGNNPPTVAKTVQTSGSGVIQFSGGQCRNCGVAMDALHSRAVIGLSLAGKPGFQFLNLSTDTIEPPTWVSPAGQISEDPLIDPVSGRLLSPAEGLYCVGLPPSACHPNYEIGNITYDPITGYAQLQFFEQQLNKPGSGYPSASYPDSAAEDCSAEIALASLESATPSTPYVADLSPGVPVFTPGNPGTWSDASSTFFPLTGSDLNFADPIGTESGPIAIAQGGSHEGILGQETFNSPANTITAFKLNFPYSQNAPFADWVTCNLGPPTGSLFLQGADPHTVSAYQSPNGAKHSFAVLANSPPASSIAIVDLDMMLNQSVVSRFPGTNVCNTPPLTTNPNGDTIGTLPATVVGFQPL